jgi:molybdopterin/thiamine biosynthesis adenylyltransferase/rhodanese-related sulfurtransferase
MHRSYFMTMNIDDSNKNSTGDFSSEEWLRYTRHLQLPQIGVSGQKKLKQSKVLIVGAGGLGSPVALYLAAAGVGQITIVDGDYVDVTNLQRQIIFTTDQVGKSKALCAKARLLALNPSIKVVAIKEHLSVNNAEDLIKSADLILDCTDNFATRYLINDTCSQYKKPWVFASIYQFSGQCALFTENSACFRCLFPDPPTDIADCNTAGVLGVLPGLLGTLQACEAVKFLTGLPCPLENNLLMVEASDLIFKKIKLNKSNHCPLCADDTHNYKIDVSNYAMTCDVNGDDETEVSTYKFNLSRELSSSVVLDVRGQNEREAFNIGGQHIPINLLAENLSLLDQNKTILCYCQTGIRSKQAAVLLKTNGFTVKSLRGGLATFLKENS